MNKAQKKFVEESFIGLGGIKSLTQNMMIDYLEAYSKINPTPDPELYECISTGKVISRGSSFTGANQWLTDLLRVTKTSEIITYERGKFLKTELDYFEIRKENE